MANAGLNAAAGTFFTLTGIKQEGKQVFGKKMVKINIYCLLLSGEINK